MADHLKRFQLKHLIIVSYKHFQPSWNYSNFMAHSHANKLQPCLYTDRILENPVNGLPAPFGRNTPSRVDHDRI